MTAPLGNSPSFSSANHRSLDDLGFLNNGTTVEILNSKIEKMEEEVSSKFKNSSSDYVEETSRILKSNVCCLFFWSSLGIWGQFLDATYYPLRSFYEIEGNSDSEGFDGPFAKKICSSMAFSYFVVMCMEGVLRSRYVKQMAKEKHILVIKKIRCLIADFNFSDKNTPVDLDTLSSGISEQSIPKECLGLIANKMNIDQIIDLRKLLEDEEFQPMLESLPVVAKKFVEILFNLDPNKGIFKQVEDSKAFEEFIGGHHKIWEAMIKLRKEHFREDMRILTRIGRRLLKNPDEVQTIIEIIQVNTFGKEF